MSVNATQELNASTERMAHRPLVSSDLLSRYIRKIHAGEVQNIRYEIFEDAFGKREAEIAARDLEISITNPAAHGYKYAESFGLEMTCGNGAKIVGVAGCYQLNDSFGKFGEKWEETPDGFCGVSWMAVRKNYRELGLGSALLREAERRASKMNHTMFAYADKPAVKWYQRRGYSLDSKFTGAAWPKIKGCTLLFKRLNSY